MNNMNLNHSYIGPDELIYNNDGEIHSGGFSVNSIMLKNGLSPIMTLNNNNNNNNNTNLNGIQNGGEKVSDLFNNLVIPNWSLSYNYKNGPAYEGGSYGVKKYHVDEDDNHNEDEIMEEELHEKLLNLVKVQQGEIKNNTIYKKKNTKKYLKGTNKNKQTKKHMQNR
jgi:hypothetical protein